MGGNVEMTSNAYFRILCETLFKPDTLDCGAFGKLVYAIG